MIELSYSDTYTVVKCNLVEKRELKRLLSARPDGYQFSPKFKRGIWDGYTSLFDRNNRFPSGLLGYVLEHLDTIGWEWDVSNYPDVAWSVLDSYDVPGYEYRDYQREAIHKSLSLNRGVLKMATNAGKTLVAAGIIKATGCKAVIIVPNQTLLIQTAEELERMLEQEIGQYGGGKHLKRDVTVTTMASLEKLVKLDLSDNVTVIGDETHHVSSDQMFQHIFSIPGKYRIGMSGTPLTYERLSDMKMVAAFGEVIYEVKNAQLIEAGYSAQPIINFIQLTDRIKAKDYHEAYNLGIVNNTRRNSIIANIADMESKHGPVLVICNWVEHVNNIASLNENFLTATGQTSRSDLEHLLQRFGQSNDVLVVSPIFGEGVNIPSVGTVILASGNKSHIQLLQRIGRGLRKTDTKDTVHIYDFIDASNKKYLLKHSEQRYQLYKDEGFEVRLFPVT